jgi:L-rhamnose-H+ transport protein
VNFSLHFGTDIAHHATLLGASDVSANNAMWALVFTGNYLVNFLYAAFLMVKNKTAGRTLSHSKPVYWFWALFMGISWPAGIVLMGIAGGKMGEFGKYAAFPMMLLCAVLAGNLSGALTGEWKGTGKTSKTVMLIGVFILLSAFMVLGASAKLG